MIFHPKVLIPKKGRFVFKGEVKASLAPALHKPVFHELWQSFTFGLSTLAASFSERCVFTVGEAVPIEPFDCDYTVNIEPHGICVCARDEKNLIRGFFTLLDRFYAVESETADALAADCCQIKDSADIQSRMIHYCVFAETELWEVKRFLRLCAALKYTHVVLEFWGMLKYDALKELSWQHAFTKEKLRPLVREARELGLELVPMFNLWGHASAARVMHGKHVVLDQNPSLQTYFSEDGWCWNIQSEKVRALLRQVREELLELCGEGAYFHIGCDEAYNFDFNEESMQALIDYINGVSAEMKAKGRRVLMWGDMLLYRHGHYNPKNRYTCNAPTPDSERFFLERLSRDIVIADWQYRAPEAPVETCAVFRDAGFDCILCPWDEGRAQIDAALSTVKEQKLMGYMHTTWHTLTAGMPYVTLMGVGGYENIEGYSIVKARPQTAALLRKVMPAGGDYEKAGWAKFDVGCKW